jgi:hypothetical protein
LLYGRKARERRFSTSASLRLVALRNEGRRLP